VKNDPDQFRDPGSNTKLVKTILMRNFIVVILVSGILIILGASCSRGNNTKSSKPNVVVILADDLGWNQLGCYGGPYITPNIDRLANQGMHFTDAYSSCAVCSPTRAALMTGKYPARLHLTDFIPGNPYMQKPLVQPSWQKFLPLEEITMGEVFREQGYRTALIGKWHLSREKRPPESDMYNPDKQGFDEYMVTYKPLNRGTDPEHDPHNVDSITDRSIRFIEENSETPFFLVVSHNAIHDPLMESEARIKEFEQTDPDPEYMVNSKLGAMVSRLDKGTGLLLEKLEELGLEENTIVFFCSDNGGKVNYASQHPFRMGKGWLYEGGIRVPLIARWPGKIQAASSSGLMTSSIDIFPTLLELVGLPDADHAIDGESFAEVLLGRDKGTNRDQYWHYPHYHSSGMKPASALRHGNYKLIEWHEELLQGENAYELYDLESDPGETIDISVKNPILFKELCDNLDKWKIEVGAQMPELRGNFDK
jgi:arylsulfatase A